MTPAGLPACGSVLTSRATATPLRPITKATATSEPPIDRVLMATNLDQPLSPDVAKSLPRAAVDGRLRAPSQPREHHTSIWLVAGPTVLVLALLTLATAYSGAFKIAQWAPPAAFALIVLLTLALRGGAQRLPDRWLALSVAGAWGLAAWAALSATWAASPAGALEGAGELTMYAAIFSLPLLALGDLRALRVAAYGVVGGVVLIGLYTLGGMLLNGPAIFLAGRLSGPWNTATPPRCCSVWPTGR